MSMVTLLVKGVLSRSYPIYCECPDRLCELVVRIPGYRSRDPGSIPGATRFFEK
jgi:hypothetical protein